jgi:hypothetical protein
LEAEKLVSTGFLVFSEVSRFSVGVNRVDENKGEDVERSINGVVEVSSDMVEV